MSAVLDNTYRSQRLRLRSVLLSTVAREWAVSQPKDQGRFVARVTAAVLVGQAQAVRLVDAYMATKTQLATGAGAVKGLDPSLYTIEAIRKVPADEVYSRPFGALGHALELGADFAAARSAGGASVSKLAATDLQLAQTYSARDWMKSEPAIVGYERVTGGKACELCLAAADRTYRTDELAAIHEHCSCDVVPVYGDQPVSIEALPSSIEFVDDPELGPRLVAPGWRAAA